MLQRSLIPAATRAVPYSRATYATRSSKSVKKPQSSPEVQVVDRKLDESMSAAIERLRVNLNRVVSRVGRVSAAILDPIKVEIDGQFYKLQEYANVNIKDGNTMLVNVYDKAHLTQVEKALYSSNINLSPIKIGESTLQLRVPRPDWKIRESLTREASTLCENAKTSIRATRHSAQKEIKSEITQQDLAHSELKKLDELTKKHTNQVDQIFVKAKKVLMDE